MPESKPYPSIIPGMRYRNGPVAIEWLCRAFGFEKHLAVLGIESRAFALRRETT